MCVCVFVCVSLVVRLLRYADVDAQACEVSRPEGGWVYDGRLVEARWKRMPQHHPPTHSLVLFSLVRHTLTRALYCLWNTNNSCGKQLKPTPSSVVCVCVDSRFPLCFTHDP